MPSDAAPLDLAPERFLSGDWAELVRRTGSRDRALARLSLPEPGMLAFVRGQAIASGRADGGAVREEETRLLVEKMIADFARLGAAGAIVANGIHAAAAVRQTIPAELWPQLKFDFAAGTAAGGGYAFGHVAVEEGPAPDAIVESLAAWLDERREAHRGRPKKALAALAEGAFGADAFGVRDFNQAYARIYARRRGRPKRAE
jgi:hypothetical protein